MMNRGVSKVHLYPLVNVRFCTLPLSDCRLVSRRKPFSRLLRRWNGERRRYVPPRRVIIEIYARPVASFAFTRPLSNEAIATLVRVRRLPSVFSCVYNATSINKIDKLRAISNIDLYVIAIYVNYYKTASLKMR